jgi:hypothetical protein
VNISSIGAHRRLPHIGSRVQSFRTVGREESQHVVLWEEGQPKNGGSFDGDSDSC